MNKKGNAILDSITVIIILGVMALLTIISYQALTDVNTDIQADTEMINESKTLMSDMTSDYPNYMDGGFIVLLVMLWILVIVMSFMVDTHPIFLVLSLLLLVFVLFIGGLITNTFEEITGDADLATAASNFPMTSFIFNHFFETILVIAFSTVLALFAKSRM